MRMNIPWMATPNNTETTMMKAMIYHALGFTVRLPQRTGLQLSGRRGIRTDAPNRYLRFLQQKGTRFDLPAPNSLQASIVGHAGSL